MAKEYKIGPYSAYAIAVKHGYTGTEEEWAALQKNAPVYAQSAGNSATRAADSASQAAASRQESAKYAETAVSAAADAARQAADASASRDAAVDSAASAKADAETTAQYAADTQAAAAAAEAAASRAEAVRDSIPEDYAALDAQVRQNTVDILLRAPAIVEEASGALVTVDDAASQPAVSVVSHITATQSGSGDPSPDNVRLISGWDTAGLTKTGKNLVNFPDYVGVRNDEIRKETSAAFEAVPYEEATQYTFSAEGEIDAGTGWNGIEVEYTDGNMTYYRMFDATGTIAKAVTTTAGKTVKRILFTFDIVNGGITIRNAQLEKGSAATAYEPYQGQTLTAVLPETVYGGTLDWHTGLLTVTASMKVLTGSETSISKYSAYPDGNVYQIRFSDYLAYSALGFCTHYALADNYRTLNTIYFGNSININAAQETTTEFCAFLAAQYAAGTPVTIVYRIAEPYTIQLTPQQLDMLRGTNNLWSDTGDTELVYAADTGIKFAKLYDMISKLSVAIANTKEANV